MPRYNVKSRIIPCDICGKPMHARGIGAHKRQVHLFMKEVLTKVSDNNSRNVTKVTRKKNNDLFERQNPTSNDSEYVERLQCYNCKDWFLPEDTEPTFSNLPSEYMPTQCIKCYYKDKPFTG